MMMFFQQKTLKSVCSQRVKAKNSGFTMIELAVVLLLVGLATGGSLSGWAHYVEKQKVENTDTRFETILDSLSAYVQNHKRLPCPADPNGDGTERNAGYCYDNTDAQTLYRQAEGVLPWRELGLPENMVKDGWGRYITYRPAPHLTVMTESLLMQQSSNMSIHNACRSPVWFSNGAFGGNHLDRAKALFCCNMAPKADYLTNEAAQATEVLPASWRDQAINSTGDNNFVQSAHRWMDPARDPNFAGTFENPRHGSASPDAPLIRATTHAVTLISHGGNGFLSFMRGQSGTTRQQGTVDAGGVVTANAAMSVDEMGMISQPETVAGTAYHPKATGYDPLGKMSGASDDRVVYLRSDQLFARLGAATCARPAFGICFSGGSGNGAPPKNISFILDSSSSMLEASKFRAETQVQGETKTVPVSRWQLASKAVLAVSEVVIDKKKESYNGGNGIAAEDVGMVGFNTFFTEWGTGGSVYKLDGSGVGGDPEKLYTNGGVTIADQISALEIKISRIDWGVPQYINSIAMIEEVLRNNNYQSGYTRSDYEDFLVRYQGLLAALEAEIAGYEAEILALSSSSFDPDVYLDSRLEQMEAFMGWVRPPLSGGDSNAPGRGTPLIESILETAAIKYALDPDATQTIVLLTDGIDTDSVVPDDLLDVLGDTFERINPDRTVTASNVCSGGRRVSSNCQAALFQYVGLVMVRDYPNISVSVVDVAGNSVLENFYASSELEGEYTDVSNSPNPSDIVNALLEGTGSSDICKKAEEAEKEELDDMTLEGDIWKRCTSNTGTRNCSLDKCGFSSMSITRTSCTEKKGPHYWTWSPTPSGSACSNASGCNCRCASGSGPGNGST